MCQQLIKLFILFIIYRICIYAIIIDFVIIVIIISVNIVIYKIVENIHTDTDTDTGTDSIYFVKSMIIIMNEILRLEECLLLSKRMSME